MLPTTKSNGDAPSFFPQSVANTAGQATKTAQLFLCLTTYYWLKHCGVARPEPKQVLDILVLQSHWADDDDVGIDHFDFTLPDDITNYFITVSFGENGGVLRIDMES